MLASLLQIKLLLANQPPFFGSGDQQRFPLVWWVVEANILAIHRGNGQAFYIGTWQGIMRAHGRSVNPNYS